MKRIFCLAAAALLAFALVRSTPPGSDAAKLLPVEAVRVRVDGSFVTVETDTGDSGVGEDLNAAIRDMKGRASGDIFLETANFLLLMPGAEKTLSDCMANFRPACALSMVKGDAEVCDLVPFLRAHEPGLTLMEYRAGMRAIPILLVEEGRMYLVS